MKKGIIYISLLFILVIMSLTGAIWAETNGIWIEAKDIRGGTFGSDEQSSTSDYTFINPVDFNSDVEMDNVRADSIEMNTAKVKTIESNSANGNVVIQLG